MQIQLVQPQTVGADNVEINMLCKKISLLYQLFELLIKKII